jgi:hypothetical protein
LDSDPPKNERDKLLTDYNAIIRESSLLIAFTGILFGFLLNISIAYTDRLTPIDRILVMIAIISITVAISLFILPVIYHHVEYPYRDLEKFKRRAHRFMLYGFVPTGLTLYMSLAIALSSFLGYASLAIGLVPFVLVYLLYLKSK